MSNPLSKDHSKASIDALVELFSNGEEVWITISSDSMAPYLNPSDEVLLYALPSTGPRFGDCIAWRDEGRLILHRFLFCRSCGFATKGDRSNRLDGIISKDKVIGLVKSRRRAGVMVQFKRSSAYWAGLLSLIQLVTGRLFGRKNSS